MKSLTAFNFQQWIDEHREMLRPPVCNQPLFDDDDFIVMVVGGPNARKDFHYDEGPEFFYQVEGEMVLQIMQDDERVDIPIRAGEMLLLPPRIPHSPQRFENSIGLVVERKRLEHELDGFMWFCDDCNHKMYEEFLHVTDIVAQLPPLFERFFASEEHRRCRNCQAVMVRPEHA